MENSLIGAISAGVVCGVLFCITIAIICFLCYRCRRYEDEKTSQHDLLINGHVPNGHIPTVTQLVPVPGPSRQLYQFPTMPVRHMASYRPRYIEERNPDGAPKMEGHGVAVKSQTYNGPYTTSKGPVFYDVRQHGDYRSNRSPVWAQKAQEEAVATMNLGEESPKSERHFVLEENNNRASVKSNSEHTIVGSRSSRTEELKIPSPDASRREYLFTTELEQENSPSSSQPANDKTHDIYAVARKESANGVRREVRRESTRRQRRGEEGQVMILPPPDYD